MVFKKHNLSAGDLIATQLVIVFLSLCVYKLNIISFLDQNIYIHLHLHECPENLLLNLDMLNNTAI